MLNFGLTEMRLVEPRDGWPNPSVGPAASGADVVLERAQVFSSVAEAVADCAHVYATTVRKRGRRVSVVDVELNQGERTAVRAAVTLGEPDSHDEPLLSANPVIPLMPPEPPPGLEPIGPGHPMADIVHLAHGCDIRPSLTTLGPRSDGGPPIMVGKTFKGLTDELLRWQTEEFPRYAVESSQWHVQMRPALVVEIALDGVQRSTRYPGGVALRFARVVRYRPDKTPAEADTIDSVRALLR